MYESEEDSLDLMPVSLLRKFAFVCAVGGLVLSIGVGTWVARFFAQGSPAGQSYGNVARPLAEGAGRVGAVAPVQAGIRAGDASGKETERRLAEAQRQVAALRGELARLGEQAQQERRVLEARLKELETSRTEAEAALPRAAAQADMPQVPAQPSPVLLKPAPVPAPAMPPVARLPGSFTPQTLCDEDVTRGMKRGVEALLALVDKGIGVPQRRSGDMQIGEMSLAVYALLTVGKLNGDPRLHFSSPELRGPVLYVQESRPTHTYSLALQASALSLLPKRPEYQKALASARDGLLRGTSNGIYSYTNARPASSGDNSNTQYGQLGVWAAQDAGLEIPLWYWGKVDSYWRSTQSIVGSWGYSASLRARSTNRNPVFDRGGTATMTAAGVASLFLAMDQIDRSVRLQPKHDPVLDAGLTWLANNFDRYSPTLSSDLYLAYGLERVALAGGIKTLGTHDWYREGAVQILNAQRDDGTWRYDRGSPTVGTAYALLFLARGIAPVACAKLQYEGPWNARSRDCARYVHWLDKQTERDLRWEVLEAGTNVEDWRHAPMLLITGHGDPNFRPEVMASLRRYVHNGGLIFSSADQADAEFSRAIRQKYAPLVFDRKYEMLALTDKHPAFRMNYQVSPDKQPRMYGLFNGVRDGWIHSDDDITGSWQGHNMARTAHFEVPANLYVYVTGRSKTRPLLQPLEAPAPPPATRAVVVARLDYAGNADPEPAAWERFTADARQRFGVTVHVLPMRIADLDMTRAQIAHMTGTARFQLSTLEKQKLGAFLERGGVLLADAAGGSDAFVGSFKNALAEAMPKILLDPLLPDSPVYTGALEGGAKIKTLDRRLFTETAENKTRPLGMLQGELNGRPAVLLSQGDLSAGIAGLKAWGIQGYAPETCTALTWNALLYLSAPPPRADVPKAAGPG